MNLEDGHCHRLSWQRKEGRLRRIELFSGVGQSVSQSVRTWTQSLGKGGSIEELPRHE